MDNENIPNGGNGQGQELALSEHEIRVNKVKKLREAGIEPWPYREQVDATCKQVKDEYKEESEKSYKVAGRVLTVRLHGKTGFCTIQDRSGKLQIYIKKDIVGDQAFEFFKDFVDMGDIVWFSGTVFTTKTGEITIKAENLKLLSKCLYPLPEKFHGIADIEIKYRQRYLDLITSPESVAKFKKRSAIVKELRNFLDDHGFMEVETPMLHPIPGGAAARPFITHHNTLDSDFYLRIAPELYLKRLVVGGLERVYEVNRNFRNEGVSTKHNPEFTMLEYYMAHEDYIYAMDFLEAMLKKVAKETCNYACDVIEFDSSVDDDTVIVTFGEHKLDFTKPFERLSMQDSVIKYGDCAKEDLSKENIDKTLKKKNIEFDKKLSWGHKLALLFEELVEHKLIQPTFITKFPVEISPLAKTCPDDPQVTSRFELFVAGMELANGFNELNDPFDQAQRFKAQAQAKEAGDDEAHHYDADYVLALEHALTPTVGVGVGIDRLVMLLTDTTSIKDVILFPTLKKK